MNPSQFDEQPRQQNEGGGKKTKNKVRSPHRGLGLWLDELRIKRTVWSWRRKTKKQKKRSRYTKRIRQIPYLHTAGNALYLIGFWVEYAAVCMARTTLKVTDAILRHLGQLLVMVLRPFLLGIITLWEDLTGPFVRMYSGFRHIRELSEELPDASNREVRTEKLRYFLRGTRLYLPLVWNAIAYILPVGAAFALTYVVSTGLESHYILNVQVDGVSVGYVESEQVFESAREDVQSRINNAKAIMEASGNTVADADWDITPTYTLAISGETMTESEVANAILRASSNEIGEGTAVYIDGALEFVTTDGDHLRTYLESVKSPFEDALDPNIRVSFLHDIQLVDGVYLLSSIVGYSDVVSALNQGAGTLSYTAAPGDTVQTAVDNTGVSFDSLAMLNPELTALDQELTEGQNLITGVTSPELLKVKVVERQTYTRDTPYESVTTESDEYDFGRTVVQQEGEYGLQEITQDITYVDGIATDTSIVRIDTLKEPVTELIVRGTKLKSGMIASAGSGTFMWPVPNYTYVSRWMSGYHTGADICAPYGVPVIASDSGVVTTAGYHYSYGNYVVIDHGNGYSTLYGHMSSLAVSQGQPVTQGQTIGYVGSTGNSTGNHCHFEMYQNGVRFSAQNLFSGM